MRLIDADTLLDSIENPYQRREVASWVNSAPSIEPKKNEDYTLDSEIAGYPLRHLLFIAKTLNEADLTPEYLAEKLNDAFWLMQIMIDETMRIMIEGRGKAKGVPLSVNRCRDS